MSETQTTDPTVTIVEPPKATETISTTTSPPPPPPTETKVEPKAESKSLLNEEKKDEPKSSAPDSYEAWKVPDGFEIPEATLTEVNGLFKELGVSQEAGQKLVDFYAKQVQAQIEAPYEAYANLRKGWRDEAYADAEIGNKTELNPKVRETISRALDGLDQPEVVAKFKEVMDLTGAGDHPAFIKVFNWLAQKAVEGKHVSGKGPADSGKPAVPRTPAQAMYPNLPSANQS